MTKPPVRRRTLPSPAATKRGASAVVPLVLALGLGGLVSGLVWLSGAEERARVDAEIEAGARRAAREGDERRTRFMTPSERAAIDQRARDRERSED